MSATQVPCSVIKTVKFSNGKYNIPEDGFVDVKGGVLKDCKCVWTACKDELRLYRTPVGNKIATWRFGPDVSSSGGPVELGSETPVDKAPHVTCVCELPPRGAVTNCTSPQLLVGLDCGPGRGGALYVCDSSSGSIVTTVKLAKPVSALTVVDGGTSVASRLLSSSITEMCGVAAVGLKNCGHLMLIDLRRHDPNGTHTIIFLNEGSYTVPRKYVLKGSDGTMRCYLPSFKVDVTCIQYVPCITSLLVGYNFGCFEIWDLREMKIRYVSPVMEQTIPVTHITFQEPSDDPRNYCYIWSVHNHSDEVSENSSDSCHPVAFMYALCYQWKEWVDGCGYIYEGFKGCSQQFFFEMKTYENKETIGSSSLTCQAVGTSLTRQHRSLGPEDFDDSVVEGELSLCLFAWQSVDSECKSKLRLALFDLDRWYKEEMPNSGHGSYMVVFHLEEVLSLWTTSVLDVVVDESSLQPYRSDTGHEEYYRPSALSFVSQVLFVDELVELSHPGKQQYLLSCMDKSGPLALLHPTHIFKQCLKIGLHPSLFDATPSKDMPLDKQRRFLLALALEWQMSSFLHSCAVEWASGSQSVAGCSLTLLLTWGWEFALIVKEEACKLCAPLFDNSGTKLDRAGRRMLSMYRNQLGHLAKLFRGVLNSPKIPKMYVPECVDKQATALEMISLYFELVQWFMNAGLLPEFPDASVTNEEGFLMEEHHKVLPYPASEIKQFYEDRRAELGNNVPLFVDLLLEQDKSQKLRSLWIEDGGTGRYPPPSLQALLQTYLIDVLDATAKHCLVIYLFLDIADILDERYAGAVNYLIKFPASVYMRPSVIKITQAMWLLDHKDFEEALGMLLDPMIRPTDMEQWQHRAIALAFQKQGKANLALDYILCRSVPLETLEDIRLKISILIENKKVLEAYECQSMYSVGRRDQDLMEFFVSELVRNKLLDQILFLTLTPEEEKCFLRLMEKYPINISGSTELIYFLLQSRKVEAYWFADRVERKFNENYFNEELRTVPHKYVSKSTEGLPEIERKVAALFEHKSPVCKSGAIPEPLSMTVNRYGSLDPTWFNSTGIETILRKTKETWVSDIVYDAESTVQKTPFLFAPHHLQLNRALNSARAVCVLDKKRRREHDVDSETPPKRRRMEDCGRILDRSTNMVPELQQEVNVSVLLDTPKIRRLSELKTPGRDSPRNTPVKDILNQHSILKTHSTPVTSVSSVDPPHAEDVITDQKSAHKRTIEKDEQENEKLSLSRQIRFDLPKESTRKSIVGASPRKSLSQIRDTTSKNSRSAATKRPLCFFPKQSNASIERDYSVSHSIDQVKEDNSLYLPAHHNKNINESEDKNESRGASIKGKYFFPSQTKVTDESDENQDDSFVSATSDIDFNPENIENSENRNVCATPVHTVSRVMRTSTPSDSAQQFNYKTQTESKLVYQVSRSKDKEKSISQSSSLLKPKEVSSMSFTKENVSDALSSTLDSTTKSSPSPSYISSRITKRKSYRSSNVTQEIHNIMKFKSPLKDKMKAVSEISGIEKNTNNTLSSRKASTSLIEAESDTPASDRLSTEKATGKSVLPFASDDVCYEYADITEGNTQSSNKVEFEKPVSSSGKNLDMAKINTQSETASTSTVITEKSVRKTVFSSKESSVSYECQDITVSSEQATNEVQPAKFGDNNGSLIIPGTSITDSETNASRRVSMEKPIGKIIFQRTHGSYVSSYNIVNQKQTSNSVKLIDNAEQNEKNNFCISENSSSSLLNFTSGKSADTNNTTRKSTSGSFLPENTIVIDPDNSVCSEQSHRLSHSSDNINSNLSETVIIESSSSCEDSLDSSIEICDDVKSNSSSPPKKPVHKSPKSFLPDNTVYNSPGNTSYSKKSAGEVTYSILEEHEGNFTFAGEEEIFEKSSTPVAAVATENKTEVEVDVSVFATQTESVMKKQPQSPKKPVHKSPKSFLPDNTVYNSPGNTSYSKKSAGEITHSILEEHQGNFTFAGEEEIFEKSSTPVAAVPAENRAKERKAFVPSFLPDNTVYVSPTEDKSYKNEKTSPCNMQESETNVVAVSDILESDMASTSSSSSIEGNKYNRSYCTTKASSKYCSSSDTIYKKINDKNVQDDMKSSETIFCSDTKEMSEISPTAATENKTEVDVPVFATQTESVTKKQPQSFLPNETKYDEHDETYEESKKAETEEPENLHYQLENEIATNSLREAPGTSIHASTSGTTASQNRAQPGEGGESDNKDDDSDEGWNIRIKIDAEERAVDEETEDIKPLSSINVNYMLIRDSDSSSSSFSVSCSSNLEDELSEEMSDDTSEGMSEETSEEMPERTRHGSETAGSKAYFDPRLDPESDTEEDVAALSALHGDDVADNKSNGALYEGEESKEDKVDNVSSVVHDSVTQHTADLGYAGAKADQICSFSDATEEVGCSQSGEMNHTNSEHSLLGHEIVSAVIGGQENISTPVKETLQSTTAEQTVKSRKRGARCCSEPPNSQYSLRKQKLKTSYSTSSVKNFKSTKKINSESTGDKNDTTAKEPDAIHETSPVHRKSNNLLLAANESPRSTNGHSSNDLPEIQYASSPVDIHKSIQEWMNSPVVTRAGYRRLSSIQSEPPQMDDVGDVESRARTRFKKTNSVIMESSFSKKSGHGGNQLHQEPPGSQAVNSEAQNAERENQMEQYATARRLTRYQRSLLAKSVDLPATRESHKRRQKMQSTPSPSKSSGTSRHSSPLQDSQLMPSPGNADDISVAHSEESDLASSVTTGSVLQISPKSAHSENVNKGSSRRNRSSATRSPTSVKSLPVRPRKGPSQRGVRKLSTNQKLKGVADDQEEQHAETHFSPPVRRTRSHSDISDGDNKSSNEKSCTSPPRADTKAKPRVTRSQARQGIQNVSVLTLQPIPEESGSSSADNQLTDTSNTDHRKRKHSSRSPAGSNQTASSRISPRKAMRLRSRLLR